MGRPLRKPALPFFMLPGPRHVSPPMAPRADGTGSSRPLGDRYKTSSTAVVPARRKRDVVTVPSTKTSPESNTRCLATPSFGGPPRCPRPFRARVPGLPQAETIRISRRCSNFRRNHYLLWFSLMAFLAERTRETWVRPDRSLPIDRAGPARHLSARNAARPTLTSTAPLARTANST